MAEPLHYRDLYETEAAYQEYKAYVAELEQAQFETLDLANGIRFSEQVSLNYIYSSPSDVLPGRHFSTEFDNSTTDWQYNVYDEDGQKQNLGLFFQRTIDGVFIPTGLGCQPENYVDPKTRGLFHSLIGATMLTEANEDKKVHDQSMLIAMLADSGFQTPIREIKSDDRSVEAILTNIFGTEAERAHQLAEVTARLERAERLELSERWEAARLRSEAIAPGNAFKNTPNEYTF